jgi:hypothetical protein
MTSGLSGGDGCVVDSWWAGTCSFHRCEEEKEPRETERLHFSPSFFYPMGESILAYMEQ